MTQTDSVVADPVVTPRSLFFALERFESLNVEDQLPLLALVLSEELRSADLSQMFPAVPVNQAAPGSKSLDHAPLVIDEVPAVGTVAAAWRDTQITPVEPAPRRAVARRGNAAPAAKANAALIVTVMVLSFSLTAGFLVWQNKPAVGPIAASTDGVTTVLPFSPGKPLSARPQPAQDSTSMVDVRNLQPQGTRHAPIAATALPVGAFGAKATGGTATASVASPGPAADVVPAEMPVAVNFRHFRGKVEGSVLSQSGDDLVIAASIVSGRTQQTAEIQLDVTANRPTIFGLDDGLDIQSGDRITLRSAPYRNRVVVVP